MSAVWDRFFFCVEVVEVEGGLALCTTFMSLTVVDGSRYLP